MVPWARGWIAAFALLCFATACSQRDSAPANLRGYVHSFSRSRFDLGSLVSEVDQFGMHKLVGTDGTFATELVSDATVGSHDDVPFPDPRTGVYPGDADAQNAEVQSYFVTAGLPFDQIASVSADEAVLAQGNNVLTGWYSILHRGWNGVPIDDSSAYAALDAQGRSVSEQVYWPEIPGSVLAQARAFQDLLADPARRASYIEKLPASSRDSILVIRHTSWYWQGPFEAHACCRGPMPGDPCFDVDGRLLTLPDGSGNADGGTASGADAESELPTDSGVNDPDIRLEDAGTEPQLVCPESDSGRFSALPSGTCSGEGSCAIELDNSCQPGAAFTSSLPPVFECQCVSAEWQCDSISGGMGLIPCSDAGP